MARSGISYDQTKQAAVKLLSQGVAPSVQKIREVLGTGSHTTIAEHLKIWREEHANQKIHHLPSSMPEALIPAVEVFWNSASELAIQQLSAIKHELEEKKEILRLDRAAMEQSLHDRQKQLAELHEKMANKDVDNQRLQTELAVLREQHKHINEQTEAAKHRWRSQLNRAYEEKSHVIEQTENLQLEIKQLKQQHHEQIKKHQSMLHDKQGWQEKSETRWSKMIDQARIEANEQKKRYEKAIQKKDTQHHHMQNALLAMQNKHVATLTTLEQQTIAMEKLTNQLEQIKAQLHQANTTTAVLQEKLNHGKEQVVLKPKAVHHRHE